MGAAKAPDNATPEEKAAWDEYQKKAPSSPVGFEEWKRDFYAKDQERKGIEAGKPGAPPTLTDSLLLERRRMLARQMTSGMGRRSTFRAGTPLAAPSTTKKTLLGGG